MIGLELIFSDHALSFSTDILHLFLAAIYNLLGGNMIECSVVDWVRAPDLADHLAGVVSQQTLDQLLGHVCT